MKYEPVIGLEIHAQLATRTKAYCSCEVDTKALENTRVCEVCCAHPGTLPTLNRSSGEFAVKLALATHCQVNPISFFDRKNYFYPDLPKGYQITQYEVPIAVNGWLEIETEDGSSKRIGIERIQLEEDAGKSVHEGDSSLVNLNRSGTPLVEIVGRPDLRHSKEASAYLRKVLSILTYLDICKGNLQEGNFRCDVNVSLRPQGAEALGTRTEMKNLNSFRSVEKAIEAEIGRQTGLLNAGGVIVQETLNFDPMNGKITILREKSEAHDYRYFPEPDLLPLIVSEGDVERIRQTLPELPDAKIKRFVEKYEIPLYDASVLASQKTLAAYFEEAVSAYLGSAKKVSNWIMTELLRLLNESGTPPEKSPVSPRSLADLLNAVHDDKISGRIAKDVFLKMYDTKKDYLTAVQELGVFQISDESALLSGAKKILVSNPVEVEAYRNGKTKLMGFFVGELMKETKGQANPGLANKIFKELLDKKSN